MPTKKEQANKQIAAKATEPSSVSDLLRHAYVITDGCVRFEQFKRLFAAAGLDPLPKVWNACTLPGHGALGCSISHYSLVRHALEEDLPMLVVFEDDAVPVDGAAEKLAEAIRARQPDALCLSLGWNYDSDPDKGADRGAKRKVYGSQAYALFGRKAYEAYIETYEKHGCEADAVLGLMSGSAMAPENLFAQYSPVKSIHSPGGWTAEAEIEKAVNAEAGSRLSKARAELAKMQAEKAVHVAWCIDVQGQGAAQFADQLYVSVKSVRDTRAPGDSVIAHVCYANVSVELMERLHALERDGFKVATRHITDRDLAYWQQFTKHDPRSAARPWGGIVFARLWLPLLLPNVEKCVYLDADTMCRAPISELFSKPLPEGKWLGMDMGSVPEYGYNSGVMLMDFAAMRADKTLYQRLGEFMQKNTRSFYCPDQTTINRFFADRIAEIGREWNYPPTPGVADPAMAAAKLWHFYNGTQKPYRIAGDDFGRALVAWNNQLQGD